MTNYFFQCSSFSSSSKKYRHLREAYFLTGAWMVQEQQGENGLKELHVYTVQLKSSNTNLTKSDGLHFPSDAVDGRAAHDCLGKVKLKPNSRGGSGG